MVKRILTRTMQLKINSELNPNERVIWSGQPQMMRFAKRGVPLAIFGIPWTAFSIFWVYAAAGFEMPKFKHGFDFFPLFGIPFILIGIGLLLSPLWRAIAARKTVYVLTNQRAIIFSRTSKSMRVTDYLPEQLKGVYREEDDQGGGNVIFFDQMPLTKNSTLNQIGFLGIGQVREVEKMVKQLAQDA